MRIGIDATSCANLRGYGRFTRQVLRALAPLAARHELICLLDDASAAAFDVSGPNVRPVVVRQAVAPALAAAANGSRSITDMLRMTLAVRRASVDVFFSPTVYTYFPLPPRLPSLVAIHDAIAERFPALTLPSRRARLFWRAKTTLARRQARLILTVSDYAAGELVDVLGIRRDRIRVAPEAPSADYWPSDNAADIQSAAARIGLPPSARWFLYVGGLNPHKYVESLIAAHAAVVRDTSGSKPYLVLAGPAERDVFHASDGSIREAVAHHGTGDLLRFTGFVPDAELRHLYSGAVALLLVSASEGFGLPAVEAAACGTPVIATTASPLPDLLRGGGIFVPPGEVPAIAAGMRRLLDDETARLTLGHAARHRAAALSWDRCARLVLSAIEEAAA